MAQVDAVSEQLLRLIDEVHDAQPPRNYPKGTLEYNLEQLKPENGCARFTLTGNACFIETWKAGDGWRKLTSGTDIDEVVGRHHIATRPRRKHR